ncbi:ubiquinone biosynthesis O-methyltransferase, mitochondrial isoform X1 [Delphinus delphis]|uniref:ubiquinone biosynthesis O-methyltransferase, mitochondrial isoform X1 n=1 Tax=Delphinus delphis TaxID=9728 RepID=UPI0028C3B4AE|nr:ubiquinone biosynthesis O-methyltransferase, mitochondrial isoform X1 [Delphinus delphis]
MLSVKSNYSHTSVTPITATMISLALGTFLLGIFCGRDRKRWILYVTMWGGRKLSSSGSRFLGAHRSAFRGTQADCPRLTTSAAYSKNQLSWTLQIKPSVFSEYRSMCFKSYSMTFACLNRMKSYRPLTVVASPIAERRLRTYRPSGHGSRAQPFRGMWDPPGPGHEPVSPASAGGLSTTAPPGKPNLPWTRPYSTSRTTVDSSEVKTFLALAHRWWDEQGVYAPLHSMNDLRVPFIRDNLLKTVADHQPGKPLSGMKILDVGCGGGLLTEPLGRLGASVIGIDPVDENIKTAQHHKSFDPVLDKRIEYRACSLEKIVEETAETFDAVIASEVVEHVIDLEMFIQCCCQVLKPGGSLFITTINKTQLSYALGIVFSEQIAGIVPKGTHTWEKFVSPEKLESILESNGLSVQTVAGMLYNPFSGYWHWSKNTSLNYAAHAVKSSIQEHPAPAEFALKEETEEVRIETSTNSGLQTLIQKSTNPKKMSMEK